MIAQEPGHLESVQTVLVVENDKNSRTLLRGVLSKHYQVLMAQDGAEALNIIDTHSGRIDLLLTDLNIPHANGQVLAMRMRAMRPEAKVLYMSGFTAFSAPFLGFNLDAELLEKPICLRMLQMKVSQVLR
jgi:two-component system, cell cycle sensor histidine kinase and response regulator CckA